jgi:hypothetical protein
MHNVPTDQTSHVPPDSSTRMTAQFPIRTNADRASFKVWLFSNDTDRDTLYVGERLDVEIDDGLQTIAMTPDQLRPVMVVCRDPASTESLQTLHLHNMGMAYSGARAMNWGLFMVETGCTDGSCVRVTPGREGTLEPGTSTSVTISSLLSSTNSMTALFTAYDGEATLGSVSWSLAFDAVVPDPRPEAIDDLFSQVIAGRDTLLDLRLNDQSVEPGSDLSLIIVQAPINGQVAVENGLVRYRANDNFEGTDQFFYAVEEAGHRDTARVQIEVLAPLIAVDDVFEVQVSTTTNLDVLHHDRRGLALLQPDRVSIDVLDGPLLGTAQVNSDHTIQYSAPSISGVDSLTYRIHDEVQQTTATVRISIVEEPLPVARLVAVDDEYYSIEAGTTVILDVAANDTTLGPTLNDAAITLYSNTTPAGNCVLVVGRNVSFRSRPWFEGIDQFKYILSQNGQEDTADVKVEVVQPVPSGPPPPKAQSPCPTTIPNQ